MLRTNLSTRPFYNERAVQAALGALVVLAAAFTIFNAVEWRLLSGRQGELLSRVRQDERTAGALRSQAELARRSIDRAELDRVTEQVREANRLIDQRVFSWTGLLGVLERTLPPEVRVQSIRPAADREGGLTVTMLVVGRRPEDIAQLVERLEASKTFNHLYSRSETTNQQGLLEVALEGRYAPAVAAAGPAPAPAPRAVKAGRKD